MTTWAMKPETKREMAADVHCYLCGHTVKAMAVVESRRATVKAGEKCARCGSSMGAAIVLRLDRAA